MNLSTYELIWIKFGRQMLNHHIRKLADLKQPRPD